MHEGRRVDKRIHLLVLETFVGPMPEGCWGLHWDDNKSNNRLSNLRWGLYRENYKDWLRNGGSRQGENSGKSKLTDSAVKAIRKLNSRDGMQHREIAKLFGVTKSAVTCVLNGKTWKHV